jgi:hypothetical protein
MLDEIRPFSRVNTLFSVVTAVYASSEAASWLATASQALPERLHHGKSLGALSCCGHRPEAAAQLVREEIRDFERCKVSAAVPEMISSRRVTCAAWRSTRRRLFLSMRLLLVRHGKWARGA